MDCGGYNDLLDLHLYYEMNNNIRKKTKIISINDNNVEHFDAQNIANTLNTITISFGMTLDTSKGINNNNNNTTAQSTATDTTPQRRHSVGKTIGFCAPLSNQPLQRIYNYIHNQVNIYFHI